MKRERNFYQEINTSDEVKEIIFYRGLTEDSSWVQLYPNVSSLKVPSSRHVHKSLNRILIYKSESALHQRGPLGRTVP